MKNFTAFARHYEVRLKAKSALQPVDRGGAVFISNRWNNASHRHTKTLLILVTLY